MFVCLAQLGVAAATDVRKLSEIQDADQKLPGAKCLMLEREKFIKK